VLVVVVARVPGHVTGYVSDIVYMMGCADVKSDVHATNSDGAAYYGA